MQKAHAPGTFGRPQGAERKRTKAIAIKYATDKGVTPLEVMMENMRYYFNEALAIEQSVMMTSTDPDSTMTRIEMMKASAAARASAQECAKDAAPFMHPRLATFTMDDPSEGAFQLVQDQSDLAL